MMKLSMLCAALCASAFAQDNIVQVLEKAPDSNLLVDAVVAGGLAATLSGPGPFTVFAPFNQAFEALGDNIIDFVFNPHNLAELDNVLTYHVLSGAVYSNQITDGQIITTLDNKLTVTAHVNGGGVTINNAKVVKADVKASNGVIHFIDAVLVPSNFAYPKNDIVTTAVAAGLSTLVTAVKAANLVNALSYPNGPYTVFAPSNAAFAALPAATLAYLLAHPQELAQVLLYHVVDARGDFGRGGRIYSDEIKNFQVAFTMEGENVVFTVNSAGIMINGNATVITANVDTSNGVVHVIDSVLLPNPKALAKKVAAWSKTTLRARATALPNLVQLAESVPQLSTLVVAVTKGGLVNALSGPGPLTVFAPTNDAFAKLPDQFLAYLLSNVTALDEVLTYHVVSGNVSSTQLTDGEIIPTLDAGHSLTVHKDQRGAIFIDYAQVIAANNEASNGVAHIIDEVLLPVGMRARAF